MAVILITGNAGVGKSALLSGLTALLGARVCVVDPLTTSPRRWRPSALLGTRVYVVDPPARARTEWREPDRAQCDVIAFDPVYHLSNAALQVRLARQWCRHNRKTLWLIEQTRADMEARGVAIPADAIELHLASRYEPLTGLLTRDGWLGRDGGGQARRLLGAQT